MVTTGHRHSKLYLYNGIILLVTFFLSRIATMPLYYYQMYHVYAAAQQLGWLAGVIIYLGIAVDILNVYWITKLVHETQEVLRENSQQKVPTKQQ